MAMDSDGEREDDEETQNNLFLSAQKETDTCTACPGDERDGPRFRIPCPRVRVTSMVIRNSDTLKRKVEIFHSFLVVIKCYCQDQNQQCISQFLQIF